MPDIKPIRTEADYDAALSEVERLWGAKLGTPKGDRLDVLATLIDSYEQAHYPMDPPDQEHDAGTDRRSKRRPRVARPPSVRRVAKEKGEAPL